MHENNHDSVSVRAISSVRSGCGEGPIWNLKTNTISWVDIAGKKWHQTELNSTVSELTQIFTVPTVIGAVVERSNGGYFAAVKEGFGSMSSGGDYKLEIEFLPPDERMNDAKADAVGRWWIGSTAFDFTLGRGKLHVLELNKTVRTVETGLTLPNGLAWSPDNKSFYLIDSMQRIMWRYDFDLDTGRISNREVLVRFAHDASVPDGMCVANDGSLLVAIWDGSRIEVFSPDGELKEVISLPVKRPTSCTFAGKDGSTLIVTSAAAEQNLAEGPLNGLTLAVDGLKYFGQASAVYRG